jgi:hypothetical protein
MSLDIQLQDTRKELAEAQDLIKRLYKFLGSNADTDYRMWKETEKYCKGKRLV